jgi:hypothetical protein
MQKLVINVSHVSSEIFGDDAVVVNFITGKYFGMSGSAPLIWKLFESPVSREEIVASLAGMDGMTEQAMKQVREFIDVLQQEQLIVHAGIDDAAVSSINKHTLETHDFQAPILEIHDDLQELIVLDPIHDADPERGWPVSRK